MRKCTQKCRLSIERPGVPVTCCDAAWLCGRLPVFVPLLKSLALWVWPGHNQRNRDFCKDLSAPDSWFQTILLPVQNSDHGNAILRDLRVTSPTSCHGEWTWALQSLGPHVFTLQGAGVCRFDLRGVTTLTYFHISRVVSFLHYSFRDVFSWCFHDAFTFMLFFGLKWGIMRHMTLDESATTRSSSQLFNLISCDVLVMMSFWCQESSSKTSSLVVPLLACLLFPCPVNPKLVFLPFLLFPIFFPSRLPLCLLRLRSRASSEFFWHLLTRRKRCQNPLPVPKMPTNAWRKNWRCSAECTVYRMINELSWID